jgi:hypothetical protein
MQRAAAPGGGQSAEADSSPLPRAHVRVGVESSAGVCGTRSTALNAKENRPAPPHAHGSEAATGCCALRSRLGPVVVCEVEVVEARVAAMRREVDGALSAVLDHERVAVQFGEPRREHGREELPFSVA